MQLINLKTGNLPSREHLTIQHSAYGNPKLSVLRHTGLADELPPCKKLSKKTLWELVTCLYIQDGVVYPVKVYHRFKCCF